MKEVTIVGVDLAKRVFQAHGASADGAVVWLCCANLLTAELPLSPDRLILRPL